MKRDQNQMATPERVYHGTVRVLAYAFLLIGVLLLGTTLVGGGGPASLGFVLGVAFVGVGAGRIWIANRMGR
jgi:hypothetical protein